MNAIIISRIVGAVILGVIGAFTGLPIYQYVSGFIPNLSLTQGATIAINTTIFALIGFLITPYVTIKPLQGLAKLFKKATPQALISGVIGLIIGLITAAIMAYPLSLLPIPLGQMLPFVGLVLFGYLGIVLFVTRQEDFMNLFRGVSSKATRASKNSSEG
jgi:uncharacterized protein YacL